MSKQSSKFFAAIIFSLLCAALVATATGCEKQAERNKNVVVYAYDSFAGEWGAASELARLFKEETDYNLIVVDCGDAVQTMNRAISENERGGADIVLGIDNALQDIARNAEILEAYTASGIEKIAPELISALGTDNILTPYDYSHFAMIYDTQSRTPPPKSLADLTSEIYRKKIILIDPRTSTPGLGFLAWTVAVFGTDAELENFWRALKPNILSMAPGWSAAWGMFLQGEAPLVISYSTSPAFILEHENNERFVALVFNDGHVQQVEGLGLLKNAPNKDGAKAFIDFMISETAQNCLPRTQWMYPVNPNAALPESFEKAAPKIQKTLVFDNAQTSAILNRIMNILAE